jgi:hypothetical protein
MNTLLRFKKFSLNSQLVSKFSFVNFRAARFSDLKDKERTEEKIYIDKRERELMKKLLDKLNAGEKEEVKPKKENESKADSAALKVILDKHKTTVPQELFVDIVRWKKGEY